MRLTKIPQNKDYGDQFKETLSLDTVWPKPQVTPAPKLETDG